MIEMFRIQNHGQIRERIATEGELEIFDALCSMIKSDPEPELVRKSDAYVTMVIGEWDFARIKYTNRAKWVKFPIIERSTVKHEIDDPSDVFGLSDLVEKSAIHLQRLSG